MRLALVMAAGALAGAGGPDPRADVATVAIPGKAFSPAQVTVVAGDSVAWRNTDFTDHDVRAADGAFDSGPLARFGAFSEAFTALGVHPFFCTLHPFMTGSVDVVAATLAAPAAPVLPGEAVELDGRVPADTASVALERLGADGAWQPAGSATPAADGRFSATVKPGATTSYRARTALGESPAVTVAVSASVKLALAVTRHAVKVRAVPARPGLLVTVQRWARWRFDWRATARGRLDAHGRATIPLRIAMRGKARVLLSRAARGPALVESGPFFLRTGRPARVP